MKTTSKGAALVLLLACAGAGQAQIYKWVDDGGVVHFSDKPPAPSAGLKVDLQASSDGAAAAPALPYELALAVRAWPVTLFTADACPACG